MINRWIEAALDPTPITPLPRDHSLEREIVIFTDASTHGWGGVVIDGPHVHIMSGRFAAAARLHINIKEIIAVRNSIRDCPVELRGRNVFVVVDNTTAKAGIRKGVSKSFSVNLAVGRLFDAIAEKGLQQIRVAYIRSAENPADEPSRNLVSHAQVAPCSGVYPATTVGVGVGVSCLSGSKIRGESSLGVDSPHVRTTKRQDELRIIRSRDSRCGIRMVKSHWVC